MKTILAVDGNSIINRAYFGVRPLTNGRGQRTEAIYGMVNIILSQVEKHHPDSVQVAFDLHAPTFRHKMYDNYKGTRKGMEDDLRAQMEPAKDLLRAMGCKTLSLEGYEADDILGTIAALCEKNGDRCLILTGDRDSLQLISDTTNVLLVGKETVLYDREVFREKYGIDPEQFVDAKALMGDSSDCIPGVPGVGEKTALPLIARFGSLDGVYEHLDDPEIKAGVRTKLADNRDSAYLSQKLAQICKEVPLDFDFSPSAYRDDLFDLLTELEFASIRARLQANAPARALPEEGKTVCEEVSFEQLCALSGKLGVVLNDGGLYASDGEKSFFLPSPEPAMLALFFAGREIAVYDCKSFLHRLYDCGIEDLAPTDDPMIAAYVLNSVEGDFSFKSLALRHLSKNVSSEPDAALTLRLSEVLREKLEKQGSLRLYEEIELPLSSCLARCEQVGVAVDAAGLKVFGIVLDENIRKIEESIYDLAGERFNIQSPKQLGAILYDKLGLCAYGMKKTKNGFSTNAETLEKLRYAHPIVEQILDYRQLAKLRSTYVEGLLKVIGEDGRVHTSFTQTVTATGRLSSVEPNLQNIPVRTELGRELRRFFKAPEGRMLVDADYSQIELRLLAHISGDPTMIAAFRNNTDIHAATASEVFGVPTSMVTPDMRKKAKAVNFGIVYGISAFSLSDDIKVSRKEAEAYINKYFETYPGIRGYLEGEIEKGKEQGYVTTMFGRRRYIPELSSGKGMLKKFGERVAMNSPIQGTAADIIKIAMIAVDRALKDAGLNARLILQVHDELIVECDEKDVSEVSAILAREMEGAVTLSVPLTVDLHAGKTWYECK